MKAGTKHRPPIVTLGQSKNKKKLICIHGGSGMDFSYFIPYLDPLGKNVELIFYTQGFFWGDTIESLVEELHYVISAVDGEKYVLAHSFGSALLLEYLKCYENPFLKIILVSWIFDDHWMDEKAIKPIDMEKFIKNNNAKEMSMKAVGLYFTSANQSVGEKVLGKIVYNDRLMFSIFYNYLQSFDLKNALSSINCPILSLSGKDDQVVKISYVTKGTMFNNRIISVELSNCGHFPFVECTKDFIDYVESFLTATT